jgi:hypothetical protein
MSSERFERAIPAALTLGLALALPTAVSAQPLSSGSGAGTGTGVMGGESRNSTGTGLESGIGTSTGLESGTGPGSLPSNNMMLPGGSMRGTVPRLPQNRGAGAAPSMGPGVGTTFPGDPSLVPFMNSPEQDAGANEVQSTVAPLQFELARRIRLPGDRSLALQRIANAAIFSGQLPMAHQALVEAADAALLEPTPLVHDQRLISIITTMGTLAEAYLREGKADLASAEMDEGAAPLPAPDRVGLIAKAQDEWRRAAYLAGRISSYTYRSEMLYRVVDNESYGSQTILNEFPADNNTASPGDADRRGSRSPLEDRADQILVESAANARRIERPVWRDRALVAIATAAAQSGQFARGLEVARMIPQPEVRTDALVKIAEVQARLGQRDDRADLSRGATQTYREAAQAVASIPISDVRSVLAGVLIDNLISVGRFEDARSTVTLYPDQDRRMIALGAVAESQGRRGAARSAMEWIAREVPSQYQPALYRRVSNGVLSAIEANRSRDISNRER